MNEFYLHFFEIACRECCISPENVHNRDAIIVKAINQLSEKDRNFIEMLKPVYLANDPNGSYSLHNSRITRNAFQMNSHKAKKYRQEVSHKIIENIKSLIS